MRNHLYGLNLAWRHQLHDVFHHGDLVQPRGMVTRELLQKTLEFDMRFPVITFPERKLGYKFMAAEAWWILHGKNDVASIAPYSKVISQFSDDGETFFGSYGVPFCDQLSYVVDALYRDRDTRQATMTFWRQNPPATKDVPCTVSVDFKIRKRKLQMQVFMRSSDNWLGIPYDAFNFTMMACRVLELLNPMLDEEDKIGLGTMRLTAASSHIYERDYDGVGRVIMSHAPDEYPEVPRHLYGLYEGAPTSYHQLLEHLTYMKDAEKGSAFRWWER